MINTSTRQKIAAALVGAFVLLTAACASQSGSVAHGAASKDDSSLPAPGPELSRVVFLGDSVAKGEAEPLGAAMGAAHVEFSSWASDGGGNVVGPFSDKQWPKLTQRIASAKPSTVIYQITTYDWGTEAAQRAGYQRLLDTVQDAGGTLVFVTMPPIKADDFYKPHLADLDRTADVARSVAAASEGKAVVFDASKVWGDAYQRNRDGTVDRSADGIHTCPQGAARFTSWLLDRLAGRHPGFTPPAAKKWANTGWSDGKQWVGC